MENNEVREQLAAIVRQHGQGIVEDPPKLQGLLKDLVGAHRREINVLMQALRANVPGELLRSSGPTSITAERLAGKLQEETGLSLDAAQWAVTTWGNAMGLPIEFESAAAPVESEFVAPTFPREEPQRPQTTTPVPPPVISSPPPSQAPVSNPQPIPSQAWPPGDAAYPTPVRKQGLGGGAIVVIVLVVLGAIGAIVWASMNGGKGVASVGPGFTSSPSASPASSLSPSPPSPTGMPTESPTETSSPSGSPSSKPSAVGTLSNGVFSDDAGLFQFNPPPDWLMTMDKSAGSVEFQDAAHPENKADMNLRVLDSGGNSLNSLSGATVAQLKSQMGLKTEAMTDMKLGGEAAKLIRGNVNSQGMSMKIVMVLAVHSGREVVVSMGSAPTTFTVVAPVLNTSLDTWKWK